MSDVLRHVRGFAVPLGLGAAVWLGASGPARADHSIESRQIMQAGMKQWMSGQKHRMESSAPMGGRSVVITRVDRGVRWILDPERRVYQERPLDESTGAMEKEEECLPKITPVSGQRQIAGFPASGYQLACEQSPGEAVTLWMAKPTGALSAVERDTEAYYQAYERAVHTPSSGPAWGNLSGGMLNRFKDLPKGMPLAIEASDPEAGRMTVFEVVAVSTAPVDPTLFEIPAGYTKVNDFAGGAAAVGGMAGRMPQAQQAAEMMRQQLQGAAQGESGDGANTERMLQQMQDALKGLSDGSSSDQE